MKFFQEVVDTFYHLFRKHTVVHAMGDSHAAGFCAIKFSRYKLKPAFCVSLGATASGLPSPNAKNRNNHSYNKIKNHLFWCVKKGDYVILQLGEVDCGFSAWINAQKHNITLESQIDYAITNYRSFAKRITQKTQTRIVITSVVPPSIEDGQDWGEVANRRREIKATKLERTNLTRLFNHKIKAFCEADGHSFVDLDPQLIDPETSLLRPEFKNINPVDHHLDNTKFGALLETKLRAYFFKWSSAFDLISPGNTKKINYMQNPKDQNQFFLQKRAPLPYLHKAPKSG